MCCLAKEYGFYPIATYKDKINILFHICAGNETEGYSDTIYQSVFVKMPLKMVLIL